MEEQAIDVDLEPEPLYEVEHILKWRKMRVGRISTRPTSPANAKEVIPYSVAIKVPQLPGRVAGDSTRRKNCDKGE